MAKLDLFSSLGIVALTLGCSYQSLYGSAVLAAVSGVVLVALIVARWRYAAAFENLLKSEQEMLDYYRSR